MSERADDGLASTLGLGANSGMSDDAADAVFGRQDGRQDDRQDGQAVGAADYEADRRAHGADDTDGAGDLAASDPFELVPGAGEGGRRDDGEAVGAADRDADVERSR